LSDVINVIERAVSAQDESGFMATLMSHSPIYQSAYLTTQTWYGWLTYLNMLQSILKMKEMELDEE
jgi:hypothetical protein